MAEMQVEPVKAVPAGSASGLEFLAGIPGLFASQKGDVVEFLTDFEKQNRYALFPISASLPDPIPSEWLGTFKNGMGAPLLKAREESECCERQCCGPFRGFTMAFVDGSSNTFFTLERPFKFDCCWNADCLIFNPQEITIKNAKGEVVGKAVQQSAMCTRFCSRAVTVYDASDKVLYVIESNDCCSKRGNNCCAPTCCNETYEVDVYGPDKNLINHSAWLFPGCNCKGLNAFSNFVMRFEDGSSPEKRACLLAGLFLIEYLTMENRRQENKG